VRTPHLAPALAALLLAAAGLVACDLYAIRIENRYLHALAEPMFPIKWQGSALQRAAFNESDLLPLYGSSELLMPNPFHASRIFKSYPSGFNIFPVGNGATTCLIILQRLAAVGPDLRGKKVVITLTPGLFFLRKMVGEEAYAGNFSRLHASALIFSPQLSLELKQRTAHRMLEYPTTLEGDPLLRSAVEALGYGSLTGCLAYAVLWPLGQLQIAVLRLQDHWETLSYIRSKEGLSPEVVRAKTSSTPYNWSALLAEGNRVARETADKNPFGFDNSRWQEQLREAGSVDRNVRTDPAFLSGLEQSKEWGDLELLLQGLRDLEAHALVLSLPIKGIYFDHRGISAGARGAFYAKLRGLTSQYDVPTLDFAEYDGDKFFSMDFASHLSAKGWTTVAKVLDAFYHDQSEAFIESSRARSSRPSAQPASSMAPVESPAAPRHAETKMRVLKGRAPYEGTHDRCDCVRISGWAWDRTRPDTPLEVEIYDGPKLLAKVTADVLRPGLLDRGKGNGRHAFIFTTPAGLKDGQPHVIRIKVAGTDSELNQTPKTLTCPDPAK
jgi:D-alanine transfer protein